MVWVLVAHQERDLRLTLSIAGHHSTASYRAGGESGQSALVAMLALFAIPILVLVWIGFTLTYWALGWGVLAVVLIGISALVTLRVERLEWSGALTRCEDREPLWLTIRDCSLALLGTIAGVSILLLMVIVLHLAAQ